MKQIPLTISIMKTKRVENMIKKCHSDIIPGVPE